MTPPTRVFSAQSSLRIFAQKYLHKLKDTYFIDFILQNKYHCINEDSFGAKILRFDWLGSFMDLKIQIMYYFLVTGSSISTSASAVTAASTTSTTSTTSSGNKPPRPKWLHCNNCKSPFANAWDLMVHVQTAHMMNIYQLADTTKLQNVRFLSFSFLQKQNRYLDRIIKK